MAFPAVGISLSGNAAEAFRHGPRLHNPYCSVATYVRSDLLTQGLADIQANGKAIIYIGREEAVGDRAYRDFLMAHECCHHTRGHLLRLKEKGRENAIMSLSRSNRSMELDADCCAAMSLARAGRMDAVMEGAKRMREFGAMPTGSGGYPSGDVRGLLIEQCAMSAVSTSSMSQPAR